MKVIGITGNSGSGKTEFAKILSKKLNAKIIDADKIAKEISKPGEEYFNKIVENFGQNILIDSEINRKKLAEIIYENPEKRNILNSLTNKYVVEKIKLEILKNKEKYLIIDVPLLFESGLNKMCNITVSILAEEEIKIKRISKRDNIENKIAKKRLSIQNPDEFYIKNSNYIIVNNNTNLEEEANNFIKIINKNKFLNDEIVVIKNEEIQYIQFKKLLENKNIVHCFTLKPMDFGDNNTYEIKKEAVTENYKKICKSLNLNFENIIRPYQTHTNNIKKINNEYGIFNKQLDNIDGIMTNEKNRILSLTFADCTPIYIFDKEKNIISLVHSGWVGTTKKIIKNAIEEMKKEYNCNPNNLICVIGPTIRKCHFEVEEDVKNIFYEKFKYMKDINEIIKKGKEKGKYNIDTVKINKNMLIEEGILEKNIIDCGICTQCNHDIIHSYRQEKQNSGRNTAILSLK